MPLLTSSNYLQWCVNRLAKETGVKVLLDGQGADEYLGGYKDFKYFAIWDLYNQGKYRQYLSELRAFKQKFGPNEKIGKLHLLDPILNRIGKKRSELNYGDSFKKRMEYSLVSELPHLLRYADRSAMAHGWR
ncbi:MAG: asparagine synthase [Bacteroidetes bacterium]|nr:asparagine synthase [Bacteroidota bacterium]